LPYAEKRFLPAIAAAALVLAFACVAASAATSAPPLHLAWRAPNGNTQWNGLSTVETTVMYQFNSVLKAMVGHRADPVYIIEDRTRTYSGASAANEVDVNDAFARRHGGPNPSDTTIKRRTRKQIVASDASGRFSIEPYLCKNEPPLNDANADPKTYTACAANESTDDHAYQDPGDAALAELPPGPVDVGKSWTFTRPVTVGREFASGTLTFVDTLQSVEERGNEQIAVIDVAATGRVNLASDLQAKGFHTGTMSLSGTAEFNIMTGTPEAQHYSGHAEWHASLLGANLGLILDEVYDAKPWTIAPNK